MRGCGSGLCRRSLLWLVACGLWLVACGLWLVACRLSLVASRAEAFRPDGRVTSFCLPRKKSPRKRAPRVRAGRASCAPGSLRCSRSAGRCATRTSLCSDMLAFPCASLRSSALPRGPGFLRPGFLPGLRGGLLTRCAREEYEAKRQRVAALLPGWRVWEGMRDESRIWVTNRHASLLCSRLFTSIR